MSRTGERDRFEKLFEEEEKELIVLTKTGASGGKRGKAFYWSMGVDMLSYVDISTGSLHQQKGRISWLAEDGDENRWKLKGESIYRLKVRKSKQEEQNRFMLLDILEENCREDRLLQELEEYRKPVVFSAKGCQELLLDKTIGLFSGEGYFHDQKCLIHLEADTIEECQNGDITATWEALYDNALEWDEKARKYAAEELAETANDWQMDAAEEEKEMEEITEEVFAERLKLSDIIVNPEGDFEIYYEDDDMFWGHVVIVSGNIRNGIEYATIAG